jgi:hypothetical protein
LPLAFRYVFFIFKRKNYDRKRIILHFTNTGPDADGWNICCYAGSPFTLNVVDLIHQMSLSNALGGAPVNSQAFSIIETQGAKVNTDNYFLRVTGRPTCILISLAQVSSANSPEAQRAATSLIANSSQA